MNLKNFLLILISILFTILGFIIFFNARTDEERNLGIGSIGLFGLTAVTFVYFTWRKKVFQKQINEDLKEVSIEGGRKFHVNKVNFYLISVLIFFLGGFLAYFVRLNLVFMIASALMSVLGFIVFFGVLFGFFAKEYLAFEEDGIRMGFRNYSFIIRWDNVMKISSDEWHSHMATFIYLINPEDTTRYLYVTRGRRDKTIKKIYNKIGWNLTMTGNHILILPERYGLDAGYFFKMLEGYLKFPETRKDLKIKKKIE
ncbi:MAG TPA: hypothetical protein PK079_13025 [Leptospiraceae bacterium]|nr:hypothetical protein [Leptospiraceae bacterium]HMX33990.1 hypothetical protein [Leptospiraceae bacterium]HMY33241.1 hypothetical protein [Leptospiraceae bacterium]HMZ65747.1 hypothetical protein [Leptospiraceae bacterium]HNA07581.1 hypothetical protein [Leptospiraceae bacterium]